MMNATTWLPLSTLALFALTACGGGMETPTSTGATSSATSGGSGGPAGTGGSDATTSATTGSGGAAGETLTLTMAPFTVPSSTTRRTR